MADEDLTQEDSKTEEPSERKKEKARKEGQVAYTKEIGTTLGFLAVTGVIYAASEAVYRAMRGQMAFSLANLDAWKYGAIPLGDKIMPPLSPVFILMGLVLLAAFIAPLVGHAAQKGVEPQFDAAQPKFDRISFTGGVKQLFSMEAFLNFLKNITKTVGFMLILGLTVRPHADSLIHVAAMPFEQSLRLTGEIFAKFLGYAALFLATIAAIDYFVSWRRLHSKLMMSRHELKEELKEVEGNPHIKQKVRQIQQERAKRQLKKTVPTATVIVTNPTHFAVALKYKRGESPVPRVVAKGADLLAGRIRELAREHKIPIIENPPLARGLYAEVKVGREIPYKFYKAVAKLIAAILKIEEEKKRQRFAGQAILPPMSRPFAR